MKANSSSLPEAQARHIEWSEVATRYPQVFRDILLHVFSLNQISPEWLETSVGQRVSVHKMIAKMNKELQEKAY